MAERTVCLCDGEYIGIESIFVVINGKQINNAEKVEALRKKSRENRLLCPCGCGAILVLVAGDRNLRKQHFRLKDGKCEQSCHMVTEGKCSVDSKIVLKCWLDDKLKDMNVKARVPINEVDEIGRKYEFSLLSKEHGIAISYSCERSNLSDEKLDILENNSKDITIIYIVDKKNGGVFGQYPEQLMKIQKRQGYGLYLSIKERDYFKAELEGVFYIQDIDGFWREVTFVQGLISKFDIDGNGLISYDGHSLEELLSRKKIEYKEEQEILKNKRKDEEEKRAERIKQLQFEEEKKREEQRINQEKREEMARQKAEVKKKQEEKQRLEREKLEREAQERDVFFKSVIEQDFSTVDRQIRDACNIRWIQCEFCGKKGVEKEFSEFGGSQRINLGTCYECEKNNPKVKEKCESMYLWTPTMTPKKEENNICPNCGGLLKEKIGKYGEFIGCSNYPSCNYTRNK